jgi:uncharacterized protein (DUF2267 family)
MLIRGMYYEGWEPFKVPIKLSLREFLEMVQQEIVTDRVINPVEITQAVLGVVASYVGIGEMDKVKHGFPSDMQNLFPALASAA